MLTRGKFVPLLIRKTFHSRPDEPILDPISIAALVFVIVGATYFAIVGANADIAMAVKAFLMVSLTSSSFLLYSIHFQHLPQWDVFQNRSEVFSILLCSIFGFVLVRLVQYASFSAYPYIYYSVADFSGKILLGTTAMAEESFFRFYVQSVLADSFARALMPVPWLWAIVSASVIMTVFHYVYSGSPAALLVVFSSSVVIGFFFVLPQLMGIGRPRLTIPILIHLMINLSG